MKSQSILEHQLHLFFLGGFSVRLNKIPLNDLGTEKARALLAYLALTPDREHSRSHLAGLLWPDVSEKQARQSLRSTLYRLRQAMNRAGETLNLSVPASEQLLTVTHQSVTLHGSGSTISLACDVEDFRTNLATINQHLHDKLSNCEACLARLNESAALYQGEFLVGFGLADAPEFEEWILLQREMLHQQALLTFGQLASTHEEQGDYEESAAYASRLLALDPFRETSQRLVMRLLALRGLPDQALAQFANCRQLMMDEFGAEPEAETVALAEQIRRGEIESGKDADELRSDLSAVSQPGNTITLHHDWHEMPTESVFFGREAEAAQLEAWLVVERCKLVSILGIGGMGKTTLAAHIIPTIADHFDLVIWRSLINAPPLTELLSTVLPVLANHQLTRVPESLTDQLHLLFSYLKERRVLLVLDNLESILQPETAEQFRHGYEPYGQLLHGIATQQHQAQLVFTSRERPAGIRQLESAQHQVCSLQLGGLDEDAGRQLLVSRGLSGSPDDEADLTQRYSGNPLALKLVADTVQDLFFGDLGEFLAEDSFIFDDVRRMLDQHFVCLTELEQEILFWLTISRQPINVPTLRAMLLHPPVGRALLEALNSLQRRALIERQTTGFTLQNVITEYLTDRLVESLCAEVQSSEPKLLHQHALLLAQAKAYVRHNQSRLILEPLAQMLLRIYSPARLSQHVHDLIAYLRTTIAGMPSYAAGNLLNLLLHLEYDVTGLDLSTLAVWQVDMQGQQLKGVNLAYSDLTNCLFRQTFGRMEAVAISPDGQLVAIGDEYGEIRLFHVGGGQLHHQWGAHTNIVTDLTFSADGRLLASCAHDQSTCIWESSSGRLLHKFTLPTGSKYSVSFSTDGRFLASGAGDETIYVWNVENGEQLLALKKHTATVRSVTFVPNQLNLISVGYDGEIFVWDLSRIEDLLADEAQRTQKQKSAIVLREADRIPRDNDFLYIWFALSQSQTLLAIGTTDGTILIFNFPDGKMLQTLTGHRGTVRDLAFWPDDSTLISASADASIRIWDIQSARCIEVLEQHQADIWSLACCPSNRTFVSGGDDGTVHIWEMTQQKRSILSHVIRGMAEAVKAVAWHPTMPIVATGNINGTIRLWDVSQANATCIHEIQESGVILTMAFSPNGQTLAVGGVLEDFAVCLWDVESGRRLETMGCHGADINSLKFAPNDNTLAAGASNGQIFLWDVTNPRQSRLRQMIEAHTQPVSNIAMSSDGKRLISAGDDHLVRIWDVDAGTMTHELAAARHNNAVACHPTEPVIAYLDSNEKIVIADLPQDVSASRVHQCLPCHIHIVYGLDFSGDGQQLASVGIDHVVRIWDLDSGEQLQTLDVAQHVFIITFSPNGHMIATAAQDGGACIWDIATSECRQVLHPPKHYEGMNITDATGVTEAQRATLKALGAVEVE